jgi:hypothetical protein
MFDITLFAQFTKSQLRQLGFVEVGSSVYMAEAQDEDWQLRLSPEEYETYKAAGLSEIRPGVLYLATATNYIDREFFFYLAGDKVSEIVEENVAVIPSWDMATRQDWIQERATMGNGNGNKGRKAAKAMQAVKYSLNPMPYLTCMTQAEATTYSVEKLWLQYCRP